MAAKINTKTLKFTLDNKVYPLEVVCAASYMFIDRAYVSLDTEGTNKIKITLKRKTKTTNRQWAGVKDEFSRVLSYNASRITIAKKNKKIRESIIGRALFSADDDQETDSSDYLDDPLGIAVPWEEKYGEKK